MYGSYCTSHPWLILGKFFTTVRSLVTKYSQPCLNPANPLQPRPILGFSANTWLLSIPYTLLLDVRVVDPHWFNADPDRAFLLTADPDPDLVPNQGFDDQELKKMYSCKTFFVSFGSKIAIYLSLGLHKGLKPSALKREHPALQNITILKSFSIFVGHFSSPGSGSGSSNSINADLCGWGIHNPVRRTRTVYTRLTVGILSAVHFQAGVEDAQSHVGRVVVSPEHVVDIQDYWLPSPAPQASRLVHLFSCTKYGAMSIHPRPMCPRPKFLGYCVFCTKCPFVIVSLIEPSLNWVRLTLWWIS